MTSPELQHFLALPRDAQEAAIRRLIARGWGDWTIASATRLSVEQIAQIRRVAVRPGGVDPAPASRPVRPQEESER